MKYLSFFIAQRFYVQKKNSSMILISIFSKLGIALSIFSLIIGFSAVNGFKTTLNQKILSSLPHGLIKLNHDPMFNWEKTKKQIEKLPGIINAEYFIIKKGLLEKNNKKKIIQIKGLNNAKYLNKYSIFIHQDDLFFKKKTIHSILLFFLLI